MTTEKVAITVPADVLSRARDAVRRGRGASLSAFVSAAIDQKLMQDDLDALLEEMLAESGGPLTARERRKADQALDGPRAPKARRAPDRP
ncbi:MAG: hypothetical protein IT385_29365 [Deltaproteobacteria bacterium]|nr:hypothetical protein [Deltaproteobacteria bacterium]